MMYSPTKIGLRRTKYDCDTEKGGGTNFRGSDFEEN